MHRRGVMIAIAGLAIAGTAAAEPARQFDYDCSATITITATVVGGPRPAPRTVTRRYAFDLDRNVWCWIDGGCADTRGPIAQVSDKKLTVLNEDKRQFEIDRVSGKMAFIVPGLQTTKGACKLAPYTEIPRSE